MLIEKGSKKHLKNNRLGHRYSKQGDVNFDPFVMKNRNSIEGTKFMQSGRLAKGLAGSVTRSYKKMAHNHKNNLLR